MIGDPFDLQKFLLHRLDHSAQHNIRGSALPAARCGCVTASTMGSDAEAKAERRGCCYGGVCRWMARHRLACLLLVLCGGAVFGIVVDRDRNLWWLLAAVTGGLPVARFVVWLLLHFVKQALPDVLLW